jgi:hypothetical protein
MFICPFVLGSLSLRRAHPAVRVMAPTQDLKAFLAKVRWRTDGGKVPGYGELPRHEQRYDPLPTVPE